LFRILLEARIFMSHICEQLIEDAGYLKAAGMSQEQLASLHHFSLKDRVETFNSTLGYFSQNRNLGLNNTNYANRLRFVAGEHRRSGKEFHLLVAEALVKWPLSS
jgi:hypothetical protein